MSLGEIVWKVSKKTKASFFKRWFFRGWVMSVYLFFSFFFNVQGQTKSPYQNIRFKINYLSTAELKILKVFQLNMKVMKVFKMKKFNSKWRNVWRRKSQVIGQVGRYVWYLLKIFQFKIKECLKMLKVFQFKIKVCMKLLKVLISIQNEGM